MPIDYNFLASETNFVISAVTLGQWLQMNAIRKRFAPTSSSRLYNFLSKLFSLKSGALRPKSHNGASRNIAFPNRLTSDVLFTFSYEDYDYQSQVE